MKKKLHLALIEFTDTQKMRNALAAFALFLISTAAFSQTITWDGSAGDGNWFTASNWDLNLVPTAAHDVVIGNGDKVEINGSAVANTVLLDGGTFSKLALASGASLTASTLTLNHGNLQGFGTFTGNVSTSGGGAHVTPGDPDINGTGTLTISGDYTQDNSGGNGGLLNIRVKSTSDFSILNVTGTATLSGLLEMQIDNSYTPMINDFVVFLTSGTLSGTFNSNNPNTWQVTYDDPSTGDVKATFDPPPPANDECSGAEAITLGNFFNGYTINSTTPITSPTCHNGNYDIWFSFTAPSSGIVLVNSYNESQVNAVALYSGSCGSLTEVNCMESNINGGVVCSQLLTSGLTSGNTYYLQVVTDDEQVNVGFFIKEPNGPANDFCSGAIAAAIGNLGDCPTGQVSGTTVNATHTGTVSCGNQYQCNYLDVWYSVTTPASGFVKFIPGTNSPIATFYSGGCGGLSEEACISGEGTAALTGSTAYFVKIATYNNQGNGMAFDFCLEEGPAPPANNECSGATAISVQSNGGCGNESGTTVNATSTVTFNCPFGGESYFDVWYSFSAPASGSVTYYPGTGSPLATIYSDCSGTVASNGCLRGTGTVDGLTSGATYYLAIFTGGSGGATAIAFDFCLEESGTIPSFNTCATASSVELGNCVTFNSIYATTELKPSCAPGSLNIPDIWYTFTAPASGTIAFTSSGGTIPLSIYNGSCGSLTEIACAIPFTGGPPALTPAATYFAQFESIGGTASGIATISAPGDFTFTGAVNNEWSEPKNWLAGSVPTGSDSPTIPDGETCNLNVSYTLTGTLTVASGGMFNILSGNTLDISGGTFTNNGTLGGQGTLAGNYTNPLGAILAPGNSPGCLSFGSDFTNTGTLEIEIGGTAACTQYDQLQVTGTANLGGTLTVTFILGYTPASYPQAFTIITAGGFNGNFVTENLPAGITWDFDETTGVLTAQSALPVELTEFRAILQTDQSMLLNWHTASETNNKGYDVERSSDGKNWQAITFVPGHGTTLEAQSYTYTDEQPVSGTNYYRLKQMDFDGKFEYSKLISVEVQLDGGKGISLFPNPANGIATLTLETGYVGEATLTLYDLLGQQMQVQALDLDDRLFSTSIDLSQLPTGVYIVEVVAGNERWQERLVVE